MGHPKRLNTLLLAFLICIAVCSAVDDTDDVTIETVEEDASPPVDIPYESPVPLNRNKVYFAEHFDDASSFDKKWVKSKAKKEGISDDIAKYDGEWSLEAPQRDALTGDLGLVLKSKVKHSAIASRLSKPFVFDAKPLIVQYEVLLQDGQECGGAYLKLLSEIRDLGEFHDKTPYSIMFGPDKCGNDLKLHFIFKHRNPLNGTVEEKHCKKPKERLEEYFSDKLPHLYTLILKPDNTFEISVDRKIVNSGSLLEDFAPPVNPPAEIDDPADRKPDDWDEREKIPDPGAAKPDDWDEDAPAQIVDESARMPDGWLETEPAHVPDADAVKPADWDSEMDGEWEPPLVENPKCKDAVGCGPWEPPLINNPEYKGKWRAPLVDNPNYKGKWKPRRIPNPDFYEDKKPFKMPDVSAVGFELWTMSKDILFDNIIITDEFEVAEKWAADTFDKKRQKIAKESVTLWGRMMKAMNYKPQYWGLYFLYCLIPISIYVWYLYTCVTEESVFQKIVNITNEYPAIWLLYIGSVVLLVYLVLVVCRKPSPSARKPQESDEIRRAAEKKKTDEATEDVREPEENEEAEEEDQEKTEKDDEEAEKNSDPDSDDEEQEDEAEAEVKTKAAGDGARKRKARKD